MGPVQAKLVVRYGPIPNQEYPLPEHTVTLGREPINDIVINDPEISRRHTRISFQDGGYVIEDLGSTNGTFVNGRRLAGLSPLSPGDVVDLGDSISFAFETAAAGHDRTLVDDASPMSAAGAATRLEPGPQRPARPQPVAVPAGVAPLEATERITSPFSPTAPRGRSTRIVAGCGCLLLLAAVLCVATVFALDNYNDGVLLYCGPLRPVWEAVLGGGRLLALCGTP